MSPEEIEVVRAAVDYSLTMLTAFESNPLMQYSGVAPGVRAVVAQLNTAKAALPKPAEPEKPADPMMVQLQMMNKQMSELVSALKPK